jgi:hypothetical protein
LKFLNLTNFPVDSRVPGTGQQPRLSAVQQLLAQIRPAFGLEVELAVLKHQFQLLLTQKYLFSSALAETLVEAAARS